MKKRREEGTGGQTKRECEEKWRPRREGQKPLVCKQRGETRNDRAEFRVFSRTDAFPQRIILSINDRFTDRCMTLANSLLAREKHIASRTIGRFAGPDTGG